MFAGDDSSICCIASCCAAPCWAQHRAVVSFFVIRCLFYRNFFLYIWIWVDYKLTNEKKYLDGFCRKRLSSVLIPFYVCIFANVIYNCVAGYKTGRCGIVLQLLGIKLVDDHMWYILEIVFFYLMFYWIFKRIINTSRALMMIGSGIVLITFFSMNCQVGNLWLQGKWWYESSIMFEIGMIIAYKKGAIVHWGKEKYNFILFIGILLFIGSLLILKRMYACEEFSDATGINIYNLLLLFVTDCQVCSYSICISLFMAKVHMENYFLKWLGSISLEIYLIHGLLMKIVPGNNISIYVILVLAGSVVFADALHNMDKRLINLFVKMITRMN